MVGDDRIRIVMRLDGDGRLRARVGYRTFRDGGGVGIVHSAKSISERVGELVASK